MASSAARQLASEPALTIVPQRRRRAVVKAPKVSDAQRGFAACRVLGHEWRHVGRATEDASRFGVYGFRSACSHCGTERTKWLVRSGESAKVAYRYPKDYATHGEDRLEPTQWRKVFIVSMSDD
jgi:hypothetical protein